MLSFFQLDDAQKSHQKLLKNKSSLENDIEIKRSTILIDKEECFEKRKDFQRACFDAKMLIEI